jgi:hypothetical protein
MVKEVKDSEPPKVTAKVAKSNCSAEEAIDFIKGLGDDVTANDLDWLPYVMGKPIERTFHMSWASGQPELAETGHSSTIHGPAGWPRDRPGDLSSKAGYNPEEWIWYNIDVWVSRGVYVRIILFWRCAPEEWIEILYRCVWRCTYVQRFLF